MKRRSFFRNSLFTVPAVFGLGSLLSGSTAEAKPTINRGMPPKDWKPDDSGLQKIIHRAEDRGGAEYGWLKANFSFSFGNWQDPNRRGFGALRVMNDDFIQPQGGFPMHPHENFEIVTVPLSGVIEHKDSLGSVGQIRAHEVQIMSAGKGIRHSEYNPTHDEVLNTLQIWVYPKQYNIEPRYAQQTFKPEDRQNRFKTVVSPMKTDGAVWINQDAWFVLGNFDAGREEKYTIKLSTNGAYLFLIDGEIEVAGEKLTKRDAIGLYNTRTFNIKMNKRSELLILDVPLGQQRG